MGRNSVKRTRRIRTQEHRLNAVSIVEDQGYATVTTAREPVINGGPGERNTGKILGNLWANRNWKSWLVFAWSTTF